MRDDFENIRAERDVPFARQPQATGHSGLWKQIALGIIVGFGVLGIVGGIGWMLFAKLALSTLQVHVP